MKAATEYKQYGITKRRFQEILSVMLSTSNDELHSVAAETDNIIADYLVESVLLNVSYEKLEQRHGILPVSKSDFYRKRRLMFHNMDLKMQCDKKMEGQMNIFDYPELLPDEFGTTVDKSYDTIK